MIMGAAASNPYPAFDANDGIANVHVAPDGIF
jgi:hypothetical protein